MNYDEKHAKLTEALNVMKEKLVGKKVVDLTTTIGYPGQYCSLRITFDDGSFLDATTGASGCNECDPEGFGTGLDLRVARK